MAKINTNEGPISVGEILPQVIDGLDAARRSDGGAHGDGVADVGEGAADNELEAELRRKLASQMEAFRKRDGPALDLANAALLEMVTR